MGSGFKHATFIILLQLVCAVLLADTARGTPFSRYQLILERRPFGEPALPEPPPREVPPRESPRPPFTKDLRLHVLTDRGGDVRVGFLDMTARPPKSYFLRVGELEDGIRVVAVDFQGGRVELAKGDERHWLSMDGRTGRPGRGQARDMVPPGWTGRADPASKDPVTESPARDLSFVERLRQRRDALRKRQKEDADAAAARAVSGDARSELEKLRDVQKAIMDAHGGPAPTSRARPSAVEEP
jgi:hypothetical protein